jgi:hypothetical protein
VQTDSDDSGGGVGLAPPVADGVLVRRVTGLALEQPPICRSAEGVPFDVLSQQRRQLVG